MAYGGGSHPGIDAREGVGGAGTAHGEGAGTPGPVGATPFDWRSPDHKDEHTASSREGLPASPVADWHSPDHKDEHTMARGEPTPAPQPAAQSSGTGGGDLAGQIAGYVSGHASQSEYDQLKGMKPRSLGERAKMDVLKSKYEPAGKG